MIVQTILGVVSCLARMFIACNHGHTVLTTWEACHSRQHCRQWSGSWELVVTATSLPILPSPQRCRAVLHHLHWTQVRQRCGLATSVCWSIMWQCRLLWQRCGLATSVCWLIMWQCRLLWGRLFVVRKLIPQSSCWRGSLYVSFLPFCVFRLLYYLALCYWHNVAYLCWKCH